MLICVLLFFRCSEHANTNPDIRGTFLFFLMPVPSPDKWRGLRQEGHPARNIGGRCRIFYNGADGRKTKDRDSAEERAG